MDYWEDIHNRIFSGGDSHINPDGLEPITADELSKQIVKWAYEQMMKENISSIDPMPYALLIRQGVEHLGVEKTFLICRSSLLRARELAIRRN